MPSEVGNRIILSQADVGEFEADAVRDAVLSGWVAPLGPDVDRFERDICQFTGARNAAALVSGTSALHFGLIALGVRPGDEVVVPTLTFAATAFAVVHAGARPVFVDVDEASWGLDPRLLDLVLEDRSSKGSRVGAVIPVDLFGRCADYEGILRVAGRYGVPVLVDAAESLGSTYRSRAAGTMGSAGIYSFNGNKIMTTSGGGMIVSGDADLVDMVRHLASQSRQPVPWYEHREIGHNYRLSNLLAALGCAQLSRLPEMVSRRRAIRRLYEEALMSIDGVSVLTDPPGVVGNAWLTVVEFQREVFPGAPTRVREELEAAGIETRPVWKPMHQQPVFADCEARLTGVADSAFEEGLCLPSGSRLTDEDIERVVEGIYRVIGRSGW